MKKRILAVVLAAAMLALLATGCSANGTADNSKDGAVAIGGLAPLTGDVSIYGALAVGFFSFSGVSSR